MMARIFITRETGHIARTDLYLVTLTLADGTVYENLEPRRLFPFTDPNRYITLLNAEEREVALVRDLRDLDDASAAALNACFAEYYRVPRITRLYTCKEEKGVIEWEVETDFGHAVFQITGRLANIKPFGDQVLIRDTNDDRYLIDSVTGLDVHSRYLLFQYL